MGIISVWLSAPSLEAAIEAVATELPWGSDRMLDPAPWGIETDELVAALTEIAGPTLDDAVLGDHVEIDESIVQMLHPRFVEVTANLSDDQVEAVEDASGLDDVSALRTFLIAASDGGQLVFSVISP